MNRVIIAPYNPFESNGIYAHKESGVSVNLKNSDIEIYNSTQYPLDQINADNTGTDIRSNEDCEILPGKWKLVKTGLFISYINHHLDVQIRSRSGLAAKKGVFVLNSPGTIDASYRGEICVILMNLGDQTFYMQQGDRIAQMTFSMRYAPGISFVDSEIYEKSKENTNRSTGGFGSSGVK